jgi:hypothetical protein
MPNYNAQVLPYSVSPRDVALAFHIGAPGAGRPASSSRFSTTRDYPRSAAPSDGRQFPGMVYNKGSVGQGPEAGRCGANMAQDIWNIPSGRSRRWVRRKGAGSRMPTWARFSIGILLAALCGTLLWSGATRFLNSAHRSRPSENSATAAAGQPVAIAWQRDTASSLETAVHEAGAGNITQAEVAIDRAAAIVTAAKFRSETAADDFFEINLSRLDRAVAAAPYNARLAEHATLMRIELAQLRSALDASPAQSLAPRPVSISSPRSIARDSTLDSEALVGNILDATMMPTSAEILEPPYSRLLVDKVRVEHLTLQGATQTLDGIHWRDVTFIGTRLRYQGGEVDLQNVHFVRCTFGFANGERSARLANVIALGQSSFVIE